MTRYDHRQPPASPRYIAAILAVFLAALCAVIARPAYARGAQEVVYVGPAGPELRAAPPAAPAPPVPQDASRAEEGCLGKARAFNYASHALDVATTVAARNNGAAEVGPLARPILGRHPSTLGLLAFKLVPLAGVRLLDEHFTKRGRTGQACLINVAFGVPALVAAGLNMRYVF